MREVTWILPLLRALGENINVMVFTDNQGAVCVWQIPRSPLPCHFYNQVQQIHGKVPFGYICIKVVDHELGTKWIRSAQLVCAIMVVKGFEPVRPLWLQYARRGRGLHASVQFQKWPREVLFIISAILAFYRVCRKIWKPAIDPQKEPR